MAAHTALTRRDIIMLLGLGALAGTTALFQSRRRNTSQLRAHDIAIRKVIESQIAAFRTQNAQAAFGFAAPDMRAQYRDAAQFMRMMRGQYRAMYHAQNISFPVRAYMVKTQPEMPQNPETRIQTALITDDRGAAFKARYMMQKQPDGAWRITRCVLETSAHRDI